MPLSVWHVSRTYFGICETWISRTFATEIAAYKAKEAVDPVYGADTLCVYKRHFLVSLFCYQICLQIERKKVLKQWTQAVGNTAEHEQKDDDDCGEPWNFAHPPSLMLDGDKSSSPPCSANPAKCEHSRSTPQVTEMDGSCKNARGSAISGLYQPSEGLSFTFGIDLGCVRWLKTGA